MGWCWCWGRGPGWGRGRAGAGTGADPGASADPSARADNDVCIGACLSMSTINNVWPVTCNVSLWREGMNSLN